VSIDRDELREVVRATVSETVPEAVRYTLEHYGVDVAHPGETQRDLQFLRSTRVFLGSVLVKILTVAALGGVTAAAIAVAQGKVHIGG